MTDGHGMTTYTYDGKNRLVSLTQPDGKQVLYMSGANLSRSGYTFSGARTQMVTSSGSPAFAHITVYEYNDRGKMSRLTDQNGGTANYTYTSDGLVQEVDYSNNTKTLYAYETSSGHEWLSSISHYNTNTSALLASFSYQYTSPYYGLRSGVSETVNGVGDSVSYTYDEFCRLTGETRTGSSQYTYSYAYDLAGNRISMNQNGTITNYVYDAANKMTQAGSVSYAYDGAGNLQAESSGGVTTTYSWNWRNQLTGISGGQSASFVYDGLGNRVLDTVGNVVTEFMLDGKEVAEAIDGSGSATSYVGRGLVCRIVGGTRTVYYGDGLGSTRVTTDSTGSIASTSAYDAYGNVLSGYSSMAFGYAGSSRYFADGTGLDYLKARYYDPVTREGLYRGTRLIQGRLERLPIRG